MSTNKSYRAFIASQLVTVFQDRTEFESFFILLVKATVKLGEWLIFQVFKYEEKVFVSNT